MKKKRWKNRKNREKEKGVQAEKNKALRKKKEVEKEKVKEAELWKRLKNVNDKFRKFKNAKKMQNIKNNTKIIL